MTTLPLWVNALGTERIGWTRVGTSPYLDAQDQPTNYVYSIVKKAEIGDFDFENTAQTGTINSVTLYIYGQTAVAGNIFYIWDGATWTGYTPVLPATWGWASIAVPVLDSWAKINGAKMYIYHPNSTSRTDIDAAYLLVDYTLGAIEIIVSAASNAKAAAIPVSVLNLQKSAGANTKATAIPRWSLNLQKLSQTVCRETVAFTYLTNIVKASSVNARTIVNQVWNCNLNVSAQSLTVANATLSRTTVLSLITYVNAKALVVVEVPTGVIEIFATASALTKALMLPNWNLNLFKTIQTLSREVIAVTLLTNIEKQSSVNTKVTVIPTWSLNLPKKTDANAQAVMMPKWSLNVPATSKVNSKSNVISSWNTSLILKANALTRALTTPIWNARILFDAETLASALASLGLSYSINVVARSKAMASAAITYPLNIYVSAAALAKAPIQVGVGYQIVKSADVMVYLEPTVEMMEGLLTSRTWQAWLKTYKKKAAGFQA